MPCDPDAEPVTPVAPHEILCPVMLQGWYDPAAVRALLPQGFVVDTFGSSAWVGLIPFSIRRARLPGLPALGPLSTLPEANARIYSVDPTGRRMSIDGDGRSEGATRRHRSRRRLPRSQAASRVTVRIGHEIASDDLTEMDHFLTAHCALGIRFGRRLTWARVGHPRWPIHAAGALEHDELLLEAAGLLPTRGAPVVGSSPGVDVRIEIPRSIPRSHLR